MINISLCMLVKNESHCLFDTLSSVEGLVNEIVITDDNSTDDTVSIAKLAGVTKIQTLPFSLKERGFAEAVNWTIAQSTSEWILWLDADELLGDRHLLHPLTRYPGKEVWALPRRKWLDYPNTREEYERYPDWQVRFFKRNPNNSFIGQMHIRYQCPKIHHAFKGPHIEHLQKQFRTEEKLVQRANLYPGLAKMQNVSVVGGDPLRKQ